MQVLVTGGSGVLGRATIPALLDDGHEVLAPARGELDLFQPAEVERAVAGADAVLHLATRIPPANRSDPDAWQENDRLRRDASRVLVDAAMASSAESFVVPSVAFVYPREGCVDEATPLGEVPGNLRSALDAEAQAARMAAAGRRGVALRLGLLDGPGTGNERPRGAHGATLHVEDAARALVAALDAPSGVYNVCRDGERVCNGRFSEASGWRPAR